MLQVQVGNRKDLGRCSFYFHLTALLHFELLPNEEEARFIAGEGELERAMAGLAQRAGTVVVTCGAEGARVRTGEETLSLGAPPVDPVDAVEAGDSFNAGFLRKYLEEAPLEECVEHGLLAGAYSTLKAGGTAAFDDVEAFTSFAEERREHIRVPK